MEIKYRNVARWVYKLTTAIPLNVVKKKHKNRRKSYQNKHTHTFGYTKISKSLRYLTCYVQIEHGGL